MALNNSADSQTKIKHNKHKFPRLNISQQHISFFYFMARYVSDSEHTVRQRRRLYINKEGDY